MATPDERLVYESELNQKQDTAAKGQPNGYAPLDSGGKLPVAHIPDGIGGGGAGIPYAGAVILGVVRNTAGNWYAPGWGDIPAVEGTASTFTRPTTNTDVIYMFRGAEPFPTNPEAYITGHDILSVPTA